MKIRKLILRLIVVVVVLFCFPAVLFVYQFFRVIPPLATYDYCVDSDTLDSLITEIVLTEKGEILRKSESERKSGKDYYTFLKLNNSDYTYLISCRGGSESNTGRVGTQLRLVDIIAEDNERLAGKVFPFKRKKLIKELEGDLIVKLNQRLTANSSREVLRILQAVPLD